MAIDETEVIIHKSMPASISVEFSDLWYKNNLIEIFIFFKKNETINKETIINIKTVTYKIFINRKKSLPALEETDKLVSYNITNN